MANEELQAALAEGWLVPLDLRPTAPVVVELSHPIRHGARELAALEIGLLRGVHVRQAPESFEEHDATLRMLGLLSGLPDSVLDQLTGADLTTAIDRTLTILWPLFELPANAVGMPEPHRRDWPALGAPLELELVKPVRAGTDVLSRVTFQAITGKIVRRLPNRLQNRHLPALVEGLSGMRPEQFDQLEGLDLSRALAVAQCFFAATRPRPVGSGHSSPTGTAGSPGS
jgi:hypothetical protein